MAEFLVQGEIETGGGYGEEKGDVETAPKAAKAVGLDYFAGGIKGGGDVMWVRGEGRWNGADVGLETNLDYVKGGDDGCDEGGAEGGGECVA